MAKILDYSYSIPAASPQEDAHVDPEPICKKELELVRIAGKRFAEARGLCGSGTIPLTMNDAAKLLGVDKEYLRNFESANVELVPLWLIVRAAKIYTVTTDFLLGLATDWEDDPSVKFERDIGFLVNEQHQEQLAAMAVDHFKQQNRQDALATVVAEILDAVSGISETVLRFQALNPRFEEMPAGSQLLHRTRVLRKLVTDARNKLTKCKVFQWQDKLNDD